MAEKSGLGSSIWATSRQQIAGEEALGVRCILGAGVKRDHQQGRKRSGESEILEAAEETVSRRERQSMHLQQLPSVPSLRRCFS